MKLKIVDMCFVVSATKTRNKKLIVSTIQNTSKTAGSFVTAKKIYISFYLYRWTTIPLVCIAVHGMVWLVIKLIFAMQRT